LSLAPYGWLYTEGEMSDQGQLWDKIQDTGKNTRERLGRLDTNEELRKKILPLCRLRNGEIWEDPELGHRVGVLDATRLADVKKITRQEKARLIINDPPYNLRVGGASTRSLSKINIQEYLAFSESWVRNALAVMDEHSHLYVWIGADYRDNFRPLPELLLMMQQFPELKPKNWITMRNQRGYGTQKNWMWVRQELLYYTRGNPPFTVFYTEIPKILKGYYKEIGGKRMENLQRSRSGTIRPGNVWVDIQQVFYRMEENVPGCYAQKPLGALERIIQSSSEEKELVLDFFSHSGTTLLAGERCGRRVYAFDCDPVFAELSIRRLKRYRETGRSGWQWKSPFPELNL
jgi:DNA modification methylase